MRKMAFCIWENKDAAQLRGYDQLRGNRSADQHLCIYYIDSTIPLLPNSEISRLNPSSVDLVGNPEDRFSRDAAHMVEIT